MVTEKQRFGRRRYSRMGWVAAAALLLVLPGRLQGLMPAQQESTADAGSAAPPATGDAACLGCHGAIVGSYEGTPHHLTSQPGNAKSILGSFRAPENEVHLTNSSEELAGLPLTFFLQERADGFYETAREATDFGPGAAVQTESGRIDIVTGSGMRGQSYLSWQGDKLYELPLSYWSSLHEWITSPGYRDGSADFSRPVYPRCLECHATYIHALSADPLTNRYDRSSLVPGIGCVTCHGPGEAHIALERGLDSPVKQAADLHILNPARFSRDRQVDLCALCHDGSRRVELAPTFTYVPGTQLDRYIRPESTEPPALPDVHGNQVGLLERSACFRSSATMSCSTCHDVHTSGRSLAAYSQRCLTCHRVTACPVSHRMGPSIAGNCIDCHMPRVETQAIVSQTNGKIVRTSMRTHWIRVYPASAAQALQLSR